MTWPGGPSRALLLCSWVPQAAVRRASFWASCCCLTAPTLEERLSSSALCAGHFAEFGPVAMLPGFLCAERSRHGEPCNPEAVEHESRLACYHFRILDHLNMTANNESAWNVGFATVPQVSKLPNYCRVFRVGYLDP